MKKLKYVDINGYGILVDESAEILPDTWYENNGVLFLSDSVYNEGNNPNNSNLIVTDHNNAVIFAEKELNLDVPVLNWRDWEIEQEALKYFKTIFKDSTLTVSWLQDYIKTFKETFIAGYNHNKSKYTEEDLKDAYNAGYTNCEELEEQNPDTYIQSIQKIPQYIVMSGEKIQEIIY